MYQKLKLSTKRIRVDNIPEELKEEFSFSNTDAQNAEAIIDTLLQLDDFEQIAKRFLNEPGVMDMILYLIYPKGSTLKRDMLIVQGASLGLRPVLLISAHEAYSCMGFKHPQSVKTKNTKRPSQCVDDYRDKVDLLKAQLTKQPQALAFYTELAPGYQKDWARFIYSAVKEETQHKRMQQMLEAFSLGCKSVDHYRKC